MLTEQVRARMVAAMKAGDAVEKSILRVALGEMQAAEVRSGSVLDAAAAAAIFRKLIKSNEESRAASEDPDQRSRLAAEVAVLQSLLPRTLDEAEILERLAPVLDALRAAANDGQATGIAMKHLKATDAPVEGKTVAAAVRRARA